MIVLLVAIYARYSSENQKELSIEAQLRACTEYCLRNGYEVVEQYIDRAQSARSAERPEFQRMISDAKQHKFAGVIVHKLDRFSRDRYDHAVYKKALRDAGVRLFSVLENLDSSPESIVLESVLEGFSEYYSANLARETRKGLRETALKAGHTGGFVLYGYKIVNGKYEIVEHEAQVVRQIFQTILDNKGYGSLLDDLRRRGIKTRRGNDFTKCTIYDMVQNPKYCGDYVYSTVGNRKDRKGEIITIKDAIPAIISREDWNAVHQMMHRRAKVCGGRQTAKETYLLSGILRCGECGEPMIGHRQTKHLKSGTAAYYFYECQGRSKKSGCKKKSVARDKIEIAVIDYVKSLLSETGIDAIREQLLRHADFFSQNAKRRISELEAEKRNLRRKLDHAIDLLIDDPMPALKKKVQQLEDEISKLDLRINEARSEIINPQTIEKYLVRCHNFTNLGREDKYQIIKKIIANVTVYNDGCVTMISTYSLFYQKSNGENFHKTTKIFPYAGGGATINSSAQMKNPLIRSVVI